MDWVAIDGASGRLWSSLGLPQLAHYVRRQLEGRFPDGAPLAADQLEGATARALDATARCFREIALPGYTRAPGEAALSHLHGDRYATFLACLARELHAAREPDLAARVYLLNKALHGLDLFYEVVLPEVFLLVHPVGSVVGRAQLGNFLCLYQNCSIGGSPRDGRLEYPVLGDGVLLYAKSAILGASRVGSRVVLAAGSLVVNATVPDGALVAGAEVKPGAAAVPALLARLFRGFAA